MFEHRLSRAERVVREIRWALSPRRCAVLMLRERARRAAGWFSLGVLCLVASQLAWPQIFPDLVEALPARLEDQSPHYFVYSIGTVRRGAEARCLLVIYREHQAFTVSC